MNKLSKAYCEGARFIFKHTLCSCVRNHFLVRMYSVLPECQAFVLMQRTFDWFKMVVRSATISSLSQDKIRIRVIHVMPEEVPF